MQKLTPSNILQLDNLPGFPARFDFLLGQYLREIGLRPSVYLASSLPMEGNELGDFRFVVSEKALYTWTGSVWEPLSGLSGNRQPEQQNFVEGINPSLRNQTTAALPIAYASYVSAPNTWAQGRADGTLREATVSAVYTGVEGALFTSGAFISAAPFTEAGGKPEINGICFLATSSADAGTGAGKFSATPPSGKGHWVVRCGVVVDNVNYDATKTCEIMFYPDYPIQL
jgi:hypothetical protein